MINVEKRASAHLSMAGYWLERGEALARAVVSALRVVDGWINRAAASVAGAQARRTARRELYALDDRMLADIGLRRDQVSECVEAMYRTSSSAQTEAATGTKARNGDRYESAA